MRGLRVAGTASWRRRGRALAALLTFSGSFLWAAQPAWAPCHIVEWDPAAYTVGEAAGKVTLTVTNNGGQQAQDMHVDYQTVDGTAKAPGDYTARSGTVTFGANASGELTLDIPIKNDSSDEPAERFTVRLSNVRPASSCIPPPSIAQMTATVTIEDNDPKPQPPAPSTPTRSSAPAPKSSASPSPTPTPTPTETPSPTPSPTPTPTPTQTAAAAADEDGGGLSGGALAGIVLGVAVVGGAAVILVRRRFLA